MKLSTHYSKASIIITMLVLLAGAVIYYFAINYIAQKQLDADLTEEIEEIQDYVRLHHQLPSQVDFDEDQTVFTKTAQTVYQRHFFDTVYVDPKDKKAEAGRAVSGLISLNTDHYIVLITISRESTKYLITVVGIITLILVTGLILILFLTNRYILNGIWQPFYSLLSQIKAYNVSDPNTFHLNANKVDEFNELGQAVQLMASRVKTDFEHLKSFTENASHEMMTPLAVITSKLDTLIQDETLKPEQYEQINDIYAASAKLSRLNQSLLLLVKIENNLIEDTETLNIEDLINQKLKQFRELLQGKEILVETALYPVHVSASRYLTDILLNNLFSNAIRHNSAGGKLKIALANNKLTFQNTGPQKPLNPDAIFERFQKEQRSEGTGLGLAIVKNICNLYHWQICYSYQHQLHTFNIQF